jgi:hypothetical protein
MTKFSFNPLALFVVLVFIVETLAISIYIGLLKSDLIPSFGDFLEAVRDIFIMRLVFCFLPYVVYYFINNAKKIDWKHSYKHFILFTITNFCASFGTPFNLFYTSLSQFIYISILAIICYYFVYWVVFRTKLFSEIFSK